MQIGMRNIKTALAVTISIIIANLMKLQSPFYTAIAAIISMQSSVKASFKAGRNRMYGTILGAAIGYIFALIYPGNAFLCGAGIIIIIYLCNTFKWNQSASIACIVFLAIMINLNGKDPLLYSIYRTVDTFIGIIIAVLINYFIVPPKKHEENKM